MKRNKKFSKGEKTASKAMHLVPVDKEQMLARVWTLIEPLCEFEGLELVHVEYQQESNGKVLRLYIDRPGGVSLDDCVYVSRQTSDLLDVELPDIGPYGLEVTSPGSNRPVSKETDFVRFKGKEAKVKTIRPINGQQNFKGVLSGISDGKVLLRVDDHIITIPRQEIRTTRLINYFGE